MKILFVNVSGLQFTVATPDAEPLGGTESALCYLARQLAQNGHDVSVIAHPPDGAAPDLVMGVQHFPPPTLLNGDFLAAQNFDAIVVNNAPIACPSLRGYAPKAFILLWNHVVPDHPAMRELGRPVVLDSLDGIVYVSRWQQQITEQVFGFSKPSAVIGNGFAPSFENMFASPAELRTAKENRAAYTTTPFRGLQVLLDAMAGLATGTKLDLYSSMRVYQKSGGDDQFSPLYDYAARNPLITHHGAVAQSELARRLRPVAFFAYPSTYAETFCIAALEALAAGMKVLTTATAALPEILHNRADYVAVSVEEPAKLTADFRRMMEANVAAFKAEPQAWAEERFAVLQDVNRTCTWKERARLWERLLAARCAAGTQ
jgi:glycosyltransferase involved in cell wall biosynthesis